VSNVIFESKRRFQVWNWTVSHSQLLLRSNPVLDGDTRIELLFKPVLAVCVPQVIDGIRVAVADRHAGAATLLGSAVPSRGAVFTLGEGLFVVAGSIHGRQDHLDFSAQTMFTGWAPADSVTELFSYVAPD